MTVVQAAILGIVQGVAEFLPISSSGHLVLFQELLNVNEAEITFDVFLHFATLLAILVFFWRDIVSLRKNWPLAGAVVVGTIPAAVVGILLKDTIETAFNSVLLVGCTLIVTGVLNLLSDRRMNRQLAVEEGEAITGEGMKEITPKQSLVVGLIQAIAITPGISRSGSTVFGGMMVGLDRLTAFKFSFLLAIPAIGGAAVLQLKDVVETGFVGIDPTVYLVGGVAAMMSGLASLVLLRHIMIKAQFQVFGFYCISVGLLTLALQLL